MPHASRCHPLKVLERAPDYIIYLGGSLGLAAFTIIYGDASDAAEDYKHRFWDFDTNDNSHSMMINIEHVFQPCSQAVMNLVLAYDSIMYFRSDCHLEEAFRGDPIDT